MVSTTCAGRSALLSTASILVTLVWLAGASDASAANRVPTVIPGATEIGPMVPGVFSGDLRYLPRAREWQPGDPVIEHPRRVYPRHPALEPMLSPPVLPGLPGEPVPGPMSGPVEPDRAPSGPRAFETPVLNFDGTTFTSVNPANPVGDVGSNHSSLSGSQPVEDAAFRASERPWPDYSGGSCPFRVRESSPCPSRRCQSANT